MTLKTMGAVTALAAAVLVAGCNETGENARRVTALTGDGWRFTKDAKAELKAETVAAPAFDDSAWQQVEVPHDWAIAGPFDPEADGNSGKLPWRGVGWYRRAFDVSAAQAAAVRAGGALWLEFDGVMARPEVYVNGKYAGGWRYGYMSFRVDAAPFVREGANTLAVRADTRYRFTRWYPGAGIYRAVRLVAAPAVHVAPGTVFITTPDVAKKSATVRVAFTVTNRLDAAVTAEAGVCVRDVGQAGAPKRIAAKGCADFVFDLKVANPRLWDVEDPALYLATVGVRAEGATDAQDVRFGIRTAEFTANDGFHLNGRRVQLKGVALHADLGPLGMAFNRSVMRRQLQIMKNMGVNALRTSHNPPDPQVLDLCDEMGLVVWDECFDRWEATSDRLDNENLEDHVVKNLRAFVRRDRNHPCVVNWSIGNEIIPNGFKWNGRKNPREKVGMNAERFRLFRSAIRELDTTRPVGIASCHPFAVDTGMFAELDLSGWNYKAKYRTVKAKHPDKPVVYTESAAAISSNGFFAQPPAKANTDYAMAQREIDGYEHNAASFGDIPDVEFKRMEDDRYCAGEFVWSGIDYLGEPVPYLPNKRLANRDSARSSYFGVADLMGLPKERYWLYRSHWYTKGHTVHISPHWTWTDVKSLPVYVYTDGDEAELFLNGKSLGRRRKGVSQQDPKAGDSRANHYYDVCDRYRLRWFDVPYAPGELKAVAYKNGEKIGEHVVRTAGKPAAVKLLPEETALPADGETCVFVQVNAVDAQGTLEPWAKDRVSFKLTGPGKIMAVGNANPRSYESFKDVASHPLYFGRAVVVVRRNKGETGPITLTASAKGLAPATVTLGAK